MLPEEAQFVSDLRSKVLANIAADRPPEHGLEVEDVRKALDLARKDYRAAQSKSKASGVSSPSAAPAVDLDSLFTDKKSG